MVKKLPLILFAAMLATIFTCCESVECQLNNVVLCYASFYSSSTGEKYSYPDTMTFTLQVNGTNSVIFNRAVRKNQVALPLSFWNETDTMNILTWSKDRMTDLRQTTLYVNKTNTIHYESPDCPVTMFHTIQGIHHQEGSEIQIDSITITRPEVNYGDTENLRIYFHTAD